ncbi:phospholipase [Deinococcus sp. Marseille-Q6407]|uniref:phospholipase n=1 Tax=Deinococcus sp. Marseille-Q6407 TaxID=2969223 RepID=UPI0021C08751|nr:phospholipase [Deinococcus sp. Marseille-Q6407]
MLSRWQQAGAGALLGLALSGCTPAFHPQPAPPSLLARSSEAVALIKQLGWGTPEALAAARPRLEPLWPELDWEGNGCSTPKGLDLGHREDFTPACNVHDFAYHNLRVLEPTAANRRASDEAFRRNLWAICERKPANAQLSCYSAAAAYYAAVRLRGSTRFAPGT